MEPMPGFEPGTSCHGRTFFDHREPLGSCGSGLGDGAGAVRQPRPVRYQRKAVAEDYLSTAGDARPLGDGFEPDFLREASVSPADVGPDLVTGNAMGGRVSLTPLPHERTVRTAPLSSEDDDDEKRRRRAGATLVLPVLSLAQTKSTEQTLMDISNIAGRRRPSRAM